MAQTIGCFLRSTSGASLIEYSLLTGLVSVAIVTAILAISGSLGTVWSLLAGIVSQAAS